MNLSKPLHGRSYRGGVIISDSAREKPQEAKVIAPGIGNKGEDGKRWPFEVKVGSTVLAANFGSTDVKLGQRKFTLARPAWYSGPDRTDRAGAAWIHKDGGAPGAAWGWERQTRLSK